MTEWHSNLESLTGPMYERITKALATAIESGTLKAGMQLPPQRDLAKILGVTVGTVSRALLAAARSGLIDADGRRGTVISGMSSKSATTLASSTPQSPTADLRGHGALLADWGATLRNSLQQVTQSAGIEGIFAYYHGSGLVSHRRTYANWLTQRTANIVDPESMVLTNGAQHALLCALLTVCRPGDSIACEELTYAGLRAVAPTIGLTLLPISLDEQGIIPDEFEKACRSQKVRALVCVPTIHNPTTVTMSAGRRQEICTIAKAYEVAVIEDDVYGVLSDDDLPSLRTFDALRTLTITGISKSLGPGIRAGAIIAPRHLIPALVNAVRATTWMASPLDVSIAVGLMATGIADDLLARNKQELRARSTFVATALSGFDVSVAQHSPHAWIRLPRTWTKDQFLTWSMTEGIQVLTSDSFAASPDFITHAFRISLTGCVRRETFQEAILRIASVLRSDPVNSLLIAYSD